LQHFTVFVYINLISVLIMISMGVCLHITYKQNKVRKTETSVVNLLYINYQLDALIIIYS